MDQIRVACIQNNASNIVQDNINTCNRLIRSAASDGAQLIATPEYFSGVEFVNNLVQPAAFEINEHPVIEVYQSLAYELSITLLLGSVGVLSKDGKILNQSILIDASGQVIKHYDKIHLFDVNLENVKAFKESATIDAGNSASLIESGELRLGMSVCYDLRFPQLYRQLAQAGANILSVPAAFTKKTGEAHWHVLLRARAIENACYVIAPNQFGNAVGGGPSYGHSLIIDPWGKVLADAGEEEGYIVADINLAYTDICRKRIPSLENEKNFKLVYSRTDS